MSQRKHLGKELEHGHLLDVKKFELLEGSTSLIVTDVPTERPSPHNGGHFGGEMLWSEKVAYLYESSNSTSAHSPKQ